MYSHPVRFSSPLVYDIGLIIYAIFVTLSLEKTLYLHCLKKSHGKDIYPCPWIKNYIVICFILLFWVSKWFLKF